MFLKGDQEAEAEQTEKAHTENTAPPGHGVTQIYTAGSKRDGGCEFCGGVHIVGILVLVYKRKRREKLGRRERERERARERVQR